MKIEDFIIDQNNPLGLGHSSKVFLAKHKRSHFEYALKVVDLKNNSYAEKKKLYKSLEIHKKINHQNINRFCGH